MIQKGTFLNISDNSGAKKVCCLHVYKNKKKVAKIGDLILVSIKTLRSKKRLKSKVKKGELYKALVIRTKYFQKNVKNRITFSMSFLENSVILLDKKYKLVGTRILGPISKEFKMTKYSRIVSISSNLI
jgi:large subunit ribosomal protein L14